MAHQRILVILAVTSFALGGCVAKKKYLQIEDSLRATETMVTERNQQIEANEARIARQGQEIEALAAEVQQLKAQEEALRKAIEKAETDKASLLADKGRLASDVQAMKLALREMEARKNAAEARVQSYRDLLARFKKLIDAGKLKVKIVDGNMVVELATDVLFASGSAQLSDEGKLALVEVGKVLASIEERSFQVAGHTDNVPIKTDKYPSNWELAAARAITVVNTMVEAGMPARRISAASYGEHKPAAANDTPQNRALNRRIEIVVVPDLSGLPGFNELQAVSREH
jgi:chemotaxis protein MotB